MAHSQVPFSQRLTAICLVFAPRKSGQNRWIRRDLAQFGIFALYESDVSCWCHLFEPQRWLRAGLVKFLAAGCGLNEFSLGANRKFRGASKTRGLFVVFLRAGSEARTTGKNAKQQPSAALRAKSKQPVLLQDPLVRRIYPRLRKPRGAGLARRIESNTPIWIRTRNLRFRRPMLYPIELWVLVQGFSAFCAIQTRSITSFSTPIKSNR